jgi:hypothetical protein
MLHPNRCQWIGNVVSVQFIMLLMTIQQRNCLPVEAYIPTRTLTNVHNRVLMNFGDISKHRRRWESLSSLLKDKLDSLNDPTTVPVIEMASSNEPSIVVKPKTPIAPIVTSIPEIFKTSDSTNGIASTFVSLQSEITNGIQQPQSLQTLEQPKEPHQQQLNIWAARGLLLFVAAIWGTNFAVRYIRTDLCDHFSVVYTSYHHIFLSYYKNHLKRV